MSTLPSPSLLRPILAGAAGLALVPVMRAEDLVVNRFDAKEEVPQWPTEDYPTKPNNAWERWWGGAVIDGESMSFDPSMDANGNAASGSLKLVAHFDRLGGNDSGQYSVVRYLPEAPIDGSKFLSLEMDVHFKPDSVKRADGTYGYLEVGFSTAAPLYGQIYAQQLPIPASASDQWMHISAPISRTVADIDKISGVHFKMWMGGDSDPVGASTMWVDNVLLKAPDVVTEDPPPVVRLEPATPGLHLVSSGAGIYDRQTLRTVTPEYSWVGRNQPVTYSFTLKEFPPEAGYTAFLYLTPGNGFAAGLNYVDYSADNCLVLFLNNNADGSGGMRLAYKDSAPNSNGPAGHSYWDNDDGTGKGGSLAYVNSTTVLGTWSLTFDTDTSATITAPDGQTASATLLPETAAKYANPLYAYFGAVPGDASRQGRTAVYSRIKISGTPNPIDEDFSTIPFNGLLEKSASDANGIFQATKADTPLFVKWTLPAVGYKLQQSADLGQTGWTDLPSTNAEGTVTARSERWKLLNAADLLDPKHGFFQLMKP